jgi:uncharacterized membrane protein YhhN
MLTVLYFFLATAYITLQPRIYPGHFLLKAAPILVLATAVLFGGAVNGPVRWLLLTALLFSAAGDVFLALDINGGDKFFIAGLGSFLIGHIFYSLTFLQSVAFHTASLIPIFLICILAIALAWQIWPNLGSLKIPVSLYILVSMVMGISASVHFPLSWTLIIGSIIFMLSDSVIAVQKFWRPVPYRDFLVMSSYYLAQFLLFWGLTH